MIPAVRTISSGMTRWHTVYAVLGNQEFAPGEVVAMPSTSTLYDKHL
jgi:hypothetical protein